MRGRFRRSRILLRRHGPAAPVWRRRAAILSGAVAVGLVAIAFARTADRADDLFHAMVVAHGWLPLVVTPLGFAGLAWLTRRLAPGARGSGIPQILAAKEEPHPEHNPLVSPRTAIAKFVLTALALLTGASVGREGPTVQIGATVMLAAHRPFRVRPGSAMLIAGGAAGVAAAFNTPLAGVAFAIEELAAAYEQKVTLLVMGAVLIAGIVAQGLAGDYVYFGIVGTTLPLATVLLVAPVAGVLGGIGGALFARAMLWLSRNGARMARGPVPLALGCGIVVAVLGTVTGMTWGTGYAPARAMIEGSHAPLWFGPAKFVTTLATAAAGLPGGIFAPSLATGAGLGNLLRLVFPGAPGGAIVLLGMAAYFTAVVRAPLTSVIILSEATASRGLLLPLLATALIAEGTAQLVCEERLYHGLSLGFRSRPHESP